MANILQEIEQKMLSEALSNKTIPDFKAGDVVRVSTRFRRGASERTQVCEGLVIARKNKGIRSSFTVRRIARGVGVEYTFPLFSPSIGNIAVVRRGVVRRAKLYYLRALSGKAARIKEDFSYLASKKGA